MKSTIHFHLEKQFKIKNLNCFIGMGDLGYRFAGVEVPKELLCENYNNVQDVYEMIENKICCDNVFYSDEENLFVIENDFGHVHNRFDLESFKKYFPEEKQVYNSCKRMNEHNPHNPEFIGNLDVCEETCKELVGLIYNSGIFNLK